MFKVNPLNVYVWDKNMNKVARTITQWCALITTVSLLGCGGGGSVGTNTKHDAVDPQQPVSDWEMVWNDEFDGDSINSKNWTHEVNCLGGGNNEKQCYTDSADNSYVEDGVLKIVALPAAEGAEQPYTSARLISQNKADFTYGRFEIKAKLPSGQGSWPAFWLLPTDAVYGGWPRSGEIDILEAVNLKVEDDEGVAENRIYGTLHYGQSYPDNDHSGKSYSLANAANPADDFHTYAIEWQEGEIRWYMDDYLYATQRKSDVRYNSNDEAVGLSHRGWYSEYFDATTGELTTHWDNSPFDQAFFMILNFAVGGDWPENVNDLGIDAEAFANGQTYEVDYVRVYQCIQNPDTGKGCETIRAGYNIDEADGGALVEGDAPTPTPPSSGEKQNLTIFAGSENLNWPAWDCCGGSTPAVVNDADKGDVMQFTVGASPTVNGFITRSEFIEDPGVVSPFDATPIVDAGYVRFEMNMVSAPNDTSAVWSLKMESDNASSAAAFPLTDSMEGVAPSVGVWQTYTFKLSDLAEAGLDVSAIDVVMVFPAWGAGEGAEYHVTNLVIAEDPPELIMFEDEENPSWPMWDCCGGSTPSVEIDDADHGEVAEFAIGANPTVMGFISRDEFITGEGIEASPLDASSIVTNALVQFEMKVVSMPNDSSAVWTLKIESDNASSAADFPLTDSLEGVAPSAGVWQTYTFNLADFADAGLDVSAIDVVMVFPAWGAGEGAIYRIDNARIYDPVGGKGLSLFDEAVADQWSTWDCCGGSTPTVIDDMSEHGLTAGFAIGAAPTVMGILADDDVYLDASAQLTEGYVKFDMKVTSMPNDSAAVWKFKIESGDTTTAVELNLTDSLEGLAPVADQWQTYTFMLQDLSDLGLDVSAIDVVMVFPAWGSGEGAEYRLDNFVITAP